jgi:hypothetical protein
LEKDILMANIKISDLTPAAAVLGTQEFEVNDSLTSKKVTAAQMLSYINANSGAVDLTSAQTITGVKTFSQPIVGSVTGSAATATSAGSVTGTTTAAVPTSALGSGTANSTTFLAGDRTFKTVQTGPATGDILSTTRTLSAPNYLPVDGSVYLQSTYPALFGVLGAAKDTYNVTSFTQSTAFAPTNQAYAYAMYYVGSTLYLLGNNDGFNNPRIWTSDNNGGSWTTRVSTTGFFAFTHGHFSNGVHIAIGGSNNGPIWRSTNGTSWSSTGATVLTGWGSSDRAHIETDGGNTWMICTLTLNTPNVMRSTDNGATWSSVNTGVTNIRGIAYIGGTTWHAYGASGIARVSTNGGSTWSNLNTFGRTSSVGTYRATRVGGPRLYTIHDETGDELYISYDSVYWQPVLSKINNLIGSSGYDITLFYADGVYYLQGSAGRSIYSFDGIKWFISKLIRGGSIQYAFSDTHIARHLAGYGANIQFIEAGIRTSYNPATQFIVPKEQENSTGTNTYIKT